jgi:hypothetical protein
VESVKEADRISVDQFAAIVESEIGVLKGYIAFDSDNPHVILYGTSPFICPAMPISRDLIEALQLGSTHPCAGHGMQMWDAKILLKASLEAAHPGSHAKLAVAFREAAASTGSQSRCACQGKGFQAAPQPSQSEMASRLLDAILVGVSVTCPNCGCELASYNTYVESSKAYIGAVVSISYSGACFNKGRCGSGAFDWRGTVTTATVFSVPD